MDSRKLALLCRDLADNKKAENILVLDVRKLSSITDYFVLASGSTEPHLRAIVSEITDRLRKEHELRPHAVEGELQTPWQVIDYFDVIVHVMRNDVRAKYDLETLWGDAPRVKSEVEIAETPAPKPVRKPRAPKTPKAATVFKGFKIKRPRKKTTRDKSSEISPE